MNTPQSTGKAWDQFKEKVYCLVKILFAQKVFAGMTVTVTKAGRLIPSMGYGYAFVDGTRTLPMKPSRVAAPPRRIFVLEFWYSVFRV